MEDLATPALSRQQPGRPVRSYPALLSTESAALAWAREGAPGGAVVVADYQVSRAGGPESSGGWRPDAISDSRSCCVRA